MCSRSDSELVTGPPSPGLVLPHLGVTALCLSGRVRGGGEAALG